MGFLFLLDFPLYKIKIKSKWCLYKIKTKPFLLGDEFSKTRKSTNIFFSFKNESRRLVDRVGSTDF